MPNYGNNHKQNSLDDNECSDMEITLFFKRIIDDTPETRVQGILNLAHEAAIKMNNLIAKEILIQIIKEAEGDKIYG
jgi:hypothetical protein